MKISDHFDTDNQVLDTPEQSVRLLDSIAAVRQAAQRWRWEDEQREKGKEAARKEMRGDNPST